MCKKVWKLNGLFPCVSGSNVVEVVDNVDDEDVVGFFSFLLDYQTVSWFQFAWWASIHSFNTSKANAETTLKLV